MSDENKVTGLVTSYDITGWLKSSSNDDRTVDVQTFKDTLVWYAGYLRDGAASVAASSPKYLSLPSAIASIAAEPAYDAALPFGRFQYRDELEYYDEGLGQMVRDPLRWTHSEIGAMLKEQVLITDPRIAASVPLAWRVGFMVGWLSALSVSQPDEAQAGLVVLASLVHPLLLSSSAASASFHNVPGRVEQKRLSSRSRSRRAKKSRKSRSR